MSKAHREAMHHLFAGDTNGVSWHQVAVAMAQRHPTSFNQIMRLQQEAPWVRRVLSRATKIDAIREHRIHTGASLKEAKEWVDAHWEHRNV